jgi:hypothetical protein
MYSHGTLWRADKSGNFYVILITRDNEELNMISKLKLQIIIIVKRTSEIYTFTMWHGTVESCV